MAYIQYEIKNRIACITLNRPEKRNALNDEMVKELKETFHQAEGDAEVKLIILKANGTVFSAGADLEYLKKLQQYSYKENLEDSKNLMMLFLQIYRYPKLVIAQVEGHAIAGGCGLATVCDLCYAVPEAEFGYSEVQIGFIPAIVSVFLSKKIGEGTAREYLLTGRRITASEAVASGLINGLFEKDVIDRQIYDLAVKLCTSTSVQSIAQTKKLLADSAGKPLEEALRLAAERNARARANEDCQKGIAAFLAKKKPEW